MQNMILCHFSRGLKLLFGTVSLVMVDDDVAITRDTPAYEH